MLHETRKSGRFLLVGGIILAAWCIAQITNAAEPFMLTSPAFKDGTPMPKKHANNTPGNANCVGENVSPPFAWSNPPAGTKSFALTMVDPEGRGGAGVIHWVAYSIPASVTGFAEGEGASRPINTSALNAATESGTIGDPARVLGCRTIIRSY